MKISRIDLIGLNGNDGQHYEETDLSDGITDWHLEEDVGKQEHYMRHKIQPIEFIIANNLSYLEGNIIKYITRYKYKNGVEDLKKAKQYLIWLIQQQEKS